MNPPLYTTTPYPRERAFVVKLHREADVAAGVVRGRIEHVASGMRGEFDGVDQLLGWLLLGLEQPCDETLPPQPIGKRPL